ncbi:MAG: hypothetical protein V3T83_06225 [Acidobacteriota bacterium]
MGRRFAFGVGSALKQDIEIVGIVKDSKHTSIREQAEPFVPLTQLSVLGMLTFYLRTSDGGGGDPDLLAAAVRDEVRRLDPTCPSTACAASRPRWRSPPPPSAC